MDYTSKANLCQQNLQESKKLNVKYVHGYSKIYPSIFKKAFVNTSSKLLLLDLYGEK